MSVLSLAFLNVLRRLGRSILALLAMSIAAAVLTSGLSLSKGLPPTAFGNYREYFGGDIMVFTPGFVGASPLQESDAVLVRRSIIDSGFNPLVKYYPMFAEGYYAQEDWDYKPFTTADLKEILSLPGVAEAHVHYTMPASLSGDSRNFRAVHPVELKIIPAGHWPQAAEYKGVLPYDIEVVLNSFGAPQANIDDVVEIKVPYYQFDNQGLPYVSTTGEQQTYRARVVGHVAVPTRTVFWLDAMGNTLSEQGFVHSPDVYLPEKVWRDIWAEQAGVEYPVLSFALTVENMGELKSMANSLQAAFPDLAIFPIPSFISHLNQYVLLDKFYRAPAHVWQGDAYGANPLAQQDFGMITAVLLFMNAGMLLASQMLASVAGRRNEIGILKAIGARQREVVGMILTEATILALLGATAGFAAVRLAGIHQALSNNIPFFEVLKITLREQGLVLGMTMVASLVFGVLPAWRVSRLTVMDVFRNE